MKHYIKWLYIKATPGLGFFNKLKWIYSSWSSPRSSRHTEFPTIVFKNIIKAVEKYHPFTGGTYNGKHEPMLLYLSKYLAAYFQCRKIHCISYSITKWFCFNSKIIQKKWNKLGEKIY